VNQESLRSILDERADQSATSTFIIDAVTGRSISYGAAHRVIQSIAAMIHERGVSTGESVAFAMQNSSTCALTVLGIMYGGFRATAINLVSGNQTIAYVLDHSETKLIFTELAQHELLDKLVVIPGAARCTFRWLAYVHLWYNWSPQGRFA